MKTDKYSDRMDVSTKISLYEYSIIRNPKTDKCIICYNAHLLESNLSFGDIIDKIDAIKPDIDKDKTDNWIPQKFKNNTALFSQAHKKQLTISRSR